MQQPNQIIDRLAQEIQNLITQLHAKDPNNQTFEQVGFLDGSTLVREYLDQFLFITTLNSNGFLE
jgi:hypothetical protein